MGRGADEKREFWRAAVELQRESGLSVVAFCEREGLKAPTFFAWRKKLKDESQPSSNVTGGGFATLKVVDDSADDSAVHSAAPRGGIVELISPCGIIARVREQADAATLRRVVVALREA